MKKALVITDDPAKAFQIQQTLRTLRIQAIVLDRIDPVFSCIDQEAPDIIVASELRLTRRSAYQVISAIRDHSDAAKLVPVIHLWAGLTNASDGDLSGPTVTVVAPLTLSSAKAAMETLTRDS